MDGPGHLFTDIARALGVRPDLRAGDGPIEHLAIDSRRPIDPANTAFIALRGERHDAHDHLEELVRDGVRNFIVSDARGLAGAAVNVIIVPDTLEALQRIAAWHRAHFHYPVVGITGSNGKTIVKEWIFQCLRGTEHIVRGPGSWNSQVGVPLSVWRMGREHTLGIFEAGMSRPGEMRRLRPIVAPTIGIFTNIGPAHGENFTDDHAKAREKLELFRECPVLIHCLDHAHVKAVIAESGYAQRGKVVAWSRTTPCFLQVTRVERFARGSRIVAQHAHAQVVFEIPFSDEASLENALHVITLLLHLGHAPEWIADRLEQLTPVAMRMELLEGVNASTLINDVYSNDLASLSIALDQLAMVAGDRPREVVLTDIVESGRPAEQLYRQVAALLRKAAVRQVTGIGPGMMAQAGLFGGDVRMVHDVEELLEDPSFLPTQHGVVLLKGARRFRLERLVERWQRQVHGTVLEIDLEAVRHNVNHYRSLLRPGVRIMAMVKAFGYGSGALEMARLLAHERVDRLGVAYADEGIALRQQGITLPILVMNPEPVPMELLHRFRLEATIYDRRTLMQAVDHAARVSEPPAVHIKVDTGMGRLGFDPKDLDDVLISLAHAPGLRVASIFSHLAASEAVEHDAFTREQISRFIHTAERIGAVLGYKPLWHIANSGAVARFPEAHFDMVRLGIGMHGIGVDEAETARLRMANALRTVIAQVRSVVPGDSVGYGRGYRVERPMRIAILPIGYADGLLRRLGNGQGRVWVHGRPAPFVGNICMDMCMVDVTDIACVEGDRAVVFDAEHGLDEYARDLGTIPYEALAIISQRVKRVHVHS